MSFSSSRDTQDHLDSLSTADLYHQLMEVDPAQPHHPNQRKRILSDLRLYRETGVAPSVLRREQSTKRDREERLDNVVVWLSCSDAALDARLNRRVDSMVRSGLLRENLAFIRAYVEESDRSRGVWQAIGLKEFLPLCVDSEGRFNGRDELREDDPAVLEAVQRVKTDTQQYAKRCGCIQRLISRQITWIRNRLLGRVKHLIQVDTSQLDRWEEVVQRPVENVVEHLLANSLPDVHVNHDFWEQQSASWEQESFLMNRRNRKFECSVCKKIIIGEEQWQQHLKGRVHKRHIASLKRKERAEKYFEEKRKSEGHT